MKGSKRSKTALVAVVLVIGIFAATIGVMAIGGPQKAPNTAITTQSFQSGGLSFSYPSQAVVKQLTSQDQNDGYIFWANSPAGAPQYQITARSETGLQAASALARISTTDMLVQNTRAANPKRYQDYKEETFSKYQSDGRDIIDMVFSYKNAQGTITRQRLVIVVKDANTAYILRAQSTATDFATLNQSTFTPLVNSLK